MHDTPHPAAPRFIADAMLGKLAGWLRVLGYDTAYEADIDDDALARQAESENRVLLTRDGRLPGERKVRRFLLVISEVPLEQLHQVVATYDLDWRARLFTRCRRCNGRLQAIEPDEVAGRVPVRVRAERRRFARCAGCDRIYWRGSHTRRMRRALELTFAQGGIRDAENGRGSRR